MKNINTKNAPEALGPYLQAIYSNTMVYVSGQLGIDPNTGELKPTLAEEITQICDNIKNILEAAETTLYNVVKTTVFLTNLDDFHTMNSIYATYFGSLPARSCVQVAKLPKGAHCEIEVIAHK